MATIADSTKKQKNAKPRDKGEGTETGVPTVEVSDEDLADALVKGGVTITHGGIDTLQAACVTGSIVLVLEGTED